MRQLLCLLVVSLFLAGTLATPTQAGQRLGGGVQYLKTIGDIKNTSGFDPDALGFIASYQLVNSLFKIEGDVEWILDFGGTKHALIQPQAYLLVGGLFYGGAGIGTGYFDGDWQKDPFYAARVGVDFTLGGLSLDAFALYRFQKIEVFQKFGAQDVNSITFGAMVRFRVGG